MAMHDPAAPPSNPQLVPKTLAATTRTEEPPIPRAGKATAAPAGPPAATATTAALLAAAATKAAPEKGKKYLNIVRNRTCERSKKQCKH